MEQITTLQTVGFYPSSEKVRPGIMPPRHKRRRQRCYGHYSRVDARLPSKSRWHPKRPSNSWISLRAANRVALDRLLERCIPALRRWAHGRLPSTARGMQDTEDLVQDTVISAMRRLEAFEARTTQGALQAYFRQAVMNRIRDVIRYHKRRPEVGSLPESLRDEGDVAPRGGDRRGEPGPLRGRAAAPEAARSRSDHRPAQDDVSVQRACVSSWASRMPPRPAWQ